MKIKSLESDFGCSARFGKSDWAENFFEITYFHIRSRKNIFSKMKDSKWHVHYSKIVGVWDLYLYPDFALQISYNVHLWLHSSYCLAYFRPGPAHLCWCSFSPPLILALHDLLPSDPFTNSFSCPAFRCSIRSLAPFSINFLLVLLSILTTNTAHTHSQLICLFTR